MAKIRSVNIYLLLLLATTSVVVIYFVVPPSEPAKLRIAYQNYNEVLMKAELTLDTTELSQVATGEALKKAIVSIETLKKSQRKVLSSKKITIRPFGFHLIEYEQDRALVETRIKIQNFEQDPETKKRTYYSVGNWYTEQVEMVKEDGIWKVEQIKLIEWEQW